MNIKVRMQPVYIPFLKVGRVPSQQSDRKVLFLIISDGFAAANFLEYYIFKLKYT